jgi:three-Cys-motif partner protein
VKQSELYTGREQTLVKHLILRKYLERFAHIVGSFAEALTYVDCFSGPWNVQSNNLADSSFAIALEELRKARATHAAKGRTLKLRCFFLERDKPAHAKLKEFVEGVMDAEIETRNADLESSIQEIVAFIRGGGRKSFPFVFIDPTGWTGFRMQAIRPLLQFDPGEVLINFMTGHIKRFIESPDQETQESFESLFGSGDFRSKLAGMTGQDREDAAVAEYANNAKKTGHFKFACSAIVLHPEIDRTHFHLIYLTRHEKGVEVFKDAEKRAMPVMEQARAAAHQRKRQRRTGQRELFDGDTLYDPRYFKGLLERYQSKARQHLLDALQAAGRMSYDEAWITTMSLPLVWESDLKSWIKDWRKRGWLVVEGLRPSERVPKQRAGHWLVWRSERGD